MIGSSLRYLKKKPEVGKEYWILTSPGELFNIKEAKWILIKCVYIRSGVAFFEWEGKEDAIFIQSVLCNSLHPSVIKYSELGIYNSEEVNDLDGRIKLIKDNEAPKVDLKQDIDKWIELVSQKQEKSPSI